MKHRTALTTASIAAIAALQAACIGDGAHDERSTAPLVSESPPLVTDEEAQYDAAASITEENADALFAELQASVEADLAAMDG